MTSAGHSHYDRGIKKKKKKMSTSGEAVFDSCVAVYVLLYTHNQKPHNRLQAFWLLASCCLPARAGTCRRKPKGRGFQAVFFLMSWWIHFWDSQFATGRCFSHFAVHLQKVELLLTSNSHSGCWNCAAYCCRPPLSQAFDGNEWPPCLWRTWSFWSECAECYCFLRRL